MSDTPRDPDLSNLLALHQEQVLDAIRTNQPGVIVDYDPATQRASVQPLVQDLLVPEDGGGEPQLSPVTQAIIHDVPVAFMGTQRGRVTWPVAAGDTCLILHCSSAISAWAAQGGLTDPRDPRRHDASDAIALVGLHDFAHVPTDAPTDALVIHVNGILLKLGGSDASQSSLLGDAFVSACDTFADAITTFAGTCSTTPPGTPATTLLAAATAFKSAIAVAKSAIVKLK